eukprot:349689-Chlamydomonas_euryale.AAC.1
MSGSRGAWLACTRHAISHPAGLHPAQRNHQVAAGLAKECPSSALGPSTPSPPLAPSTPTPLVPSPGIHPAQCNHQVAAGLAQERLPRATRPLLLLGRLGRGDSSRRVRSALPRVHVRGPQHLGHQRGGAAVTGVRGVAGLRRGRRSVGGEGGCLSERRLGLGQSTRQPRNNFVGCSPVRCLLGAAAERLLASEESLRCRGRRTARQ